MSREPWVLAPEGSLRTVGRVELDPEESRHLAVVLRIRAGEPVCLLDGAGWVARGVVARASRSGAEVEVSEVEPHPRERGPSLTLVMAVLQGQAMDWVMQKAVEVGVDRVLPAITEHTQLSVMNARRRMTHWRRVSRQALKQCQRAWALEIDEPQPLETAIRSSGEGVVADPGGSAVGRLGDVRGAPLLVGPEGGLSDGEKRCLDDAGWRWMWLGPHVLRAETAAVVGAALLLDVQRGAGK